MSVHRRVNWISQQRVDVPDMRAIESAMSNDFDELIKSFVTGTSQGYILAGFEVLMAGAIGGAASGLLLSVDPGSVFHINSSQSGTFYLVPTGEAPQQLNSATNNIVDGAFVPSAINYIGLEYERFLDDTTASQVYIWNPTNNSETTKIAPRAQILRYRIKITTTIFASNVLPIATVTTDAGNNVISITDARWRLFRLGQGGASPNPYYTYPWNAQSEGKNENPSTSTSNGINPFHGGDKMLNTLKDWMDAIMSEFKNIKGSTYWYSDASVSALNLLDTWQDANGSVLTGRGRYRHDETTAGLLTWTSDLFIRSINSPRTYTIPQGSVALAEGQVAYVQLVRNQDFQTSNTFTFTAGSPTVTGVLPIAGISVGDYIKAVNDPESAWRQVQNVAGSTITLTANYPVTSVQKALRSQGTYSVQVANPENVPSNGNVYWLAKRETVSGSATIAAAPTGLVRVDGETTGTTTAAHGFVEGQTAIINGAGDSSFDGFIEIDSVPTATTFTYLNEGLDATSGSGTISAAAKIYLRWLGEIDQGEDKQIDDTVSQDTLKFIGAKSETDNFPDYFSTNFILKGDNLVRAISKLDTAVATLAGLKMVGGGTISNTPTPGLENTAEQLGMTQPGELILQVLSVGGTHAVGTTFTPTISSTLNRITLNLIRNVTYNGNLRASIYLANVAYPHTPVGAALEVSANLNASGIPTSPGVGAQMDFLFSSTLNLVAGTRYVLIVDSIDSSGNASIGVGGIPSGDPNGQVLLTSSDQINFGPVVGTPALYYQIQVDSLSAGGVTLGFTDDFYLEIKGLDYTDNTISAGTIDFDNDGDVAYVIPNYTAGGPTLVPVVSTLSNAPKNCIIIARREGDNIIVGTSSTRLIPNQSTTLYSQMSDQNLDYIGAADTATDAPSYSSNIRGVSNQNLTARIGELTDAIGDEQEDRSAYFRSDAEVSWSGTSLTFSSNIVLEILNTKSGNIKTATILAANSPLNLANGQIAYITINRATPTQNVTFTVANSIPGQIQSTKDIIVFARRVDIAGEGYLHLPLHKQVIEPGQTVRLGASGSGGTGSSPKIIGGGIFSNNFDENVDFFSDLNKSNDGVRSFGGEDQDPPPGVRIGAAGGSFTSAYTGTVSSITVSLLGANGFTPGDFIIRMQMFNCDISGYPVGAAIATSTNTFDAADLPEYLSDPALDCTFDFNNVPVTAGTRYLYILDAPGSSSPGADAIIFISGNTVTPGEYTIYRTLDNNYTNGFNNQSLYVQVVGSSITQTLSFTEDMYIEIPGMDYTWNTIPASESPIAFPNDYDVAYVTPNDSIFAPTNLTVTVDELQNVPDGAIIIARREGNDIIVGSSSTRLVANQSGSLYALPKVKTFEATFLDPVSTVLPTGATPVMDGVSVQNGDRVLFTKLSSNNNRVYEASGIGTSVVWTSVLIFNYKLNPAKGDSVRITDGNAFANQLATYNGTNFVVNDVNRYFDGVSGNFYETSSIKISPIANNTTADIFTVTALGSENIIVGYSIERGGIKEVGQFYIVNNGITAQGSGSGAYTGATGVTLSADLNAGNVRFRYTSNNTGATGQIKYFVTRWSDATGGPTGIPSYTPTTGDDIVIATQTVDNDAGTISPPNTNEERYGNLFTPSSSGNISKIDVDLSGPIPPYTGNISVSIYNTTAGLPVGSPLATSNTVDISVLNGSPSQTLTCTFSTQPAVTAGTQYAYMINCPTITGGGTLQFRRDGGYSGADNELYQATPISAYSPNLTHALVYTIYVSGTSVGTPPGGVDQDIQFNNAGAFGGDSRFKWDTVNSSVNMNGLMIRTLSSSINLADNSSGTAFSYVAATFRFAVVEYSIERNGEFAVGRMLITNNGTIASYSDDRTETAPLGVTLAASVSGANVLVTFTTTSTGFAGTFKYSIRRWS